MRDFGRVALKFHQPLIGELDVEIAVEQHHAVAHVVEHGLQHGAGFFSLGARGLGRFLRGRECFLALLEFGDVAIEREQPAVLERLEGEFDELAAGGAALVMRAGAHDGDPSLRLCFNLRFRDRAEIPAPRLESENVIGGDTGTGDVRREPLEVHELPIDELPAHVLVEQHDAVAHVVEHGLHDLAGAIDLAARGGRFGARTLGGIARGFGGLLGGGERLLALLEVRDVAIDPEHSTVAERLEGELDESPVLQTPLVMGTSRCADPREALLDQGFGVIGGAIFAPDRMQPDQLLDRRAGTECLGRVAHASACAIGC